MRKSQKLLGGMFFGLMVAAGTPAASAATDDQTPGYPFQECIEQTFSNIRDLSIKIRKFAKRTGTEIGKQSNKLAETFRDGGKEIWAAATKDDEK